VIEYEKMTPNLLANSAIFRLSDKRILYIHNSEKHIFAEILNKKNA
jgi:hypothetical protein